MRDTTTAHSRCQMAVLHRRAATPVWDRLKPTLILGQIKKNYHLWETIRTINLLWNTLSMCTRGQYYLSHTAFASLRHSSFPQFLLTRQNWLTSVLLVVVCLSQMPPQPFTVPRDVRCSASQYTPHFNRRSVQPSCSSSCKRKRDATPCSSLMASCMPRFK